MDSGNRIVRVGIIGAGRVVENYHLPVLAAMPGVELAWICDPDGARALKLARLHAVGEVRRELADCGDVDVALVGIPVGCREPILEKVFERKWHALVEKPFARSCAEHDRIMRLAASAGVEVGVCFQRRMFAGTILAQRIIAQSLFGPAWRVWATEGARPRSPGPGGSAWNSERKIAGGGVMIETGCHIVDQLFTICGPRGLELELCELDYCGDIDFEARTRGTLDLGNGRGCEFGIGVSWLGELYNAIEIEFAAARLRVSTSAEDAGAWITDANRSIIARLDGTAAGGGIARGFPAAIDAEWREFLGQCASRRPSRVAAQAARLTTQFIEECYRRQPPPVANS